MISTVQLAAYGFQVLYILYILILYMHFHDTNILVVIYMFL